MSLILKDQGVPADVGFHPAPLSRVTVGSHAQACRMTEEYQTGKASGVATR